MLYREIIDVFFKYTQNTQTHCVGRTQNFLMLNEDVHKITNGLWSIKTVVSVCQNTLHVLTL